MRPALTNYRRILSPCRGNEVDESLSIEGTSELGDDPCGNGGRHRNVGDLYQHRGVGASLVKVSPAK